MNLSNLLTRWALICRLKLTQTLLSRQPGAPQRDLHRRLLLHTAAAASPAAFRRRIRLTADSRQSLAELLQPWQAADFAVLDLAWQALARPHEEHSAPSQRAWIERPRGHAKTSDLAVQIAWILLYTSHPLRGIAAAADRDQASLLWDAIQRLAKANPDLCSPLEFRKHLVANPHTGSKLEIISSDVQSSWGLLPDFVICDELCHWEKPEMWYSLLSSAAKQPHCLLTVLTNAGVGRDWHWDAREAARTSGRWYFSSLPGPHAPWITDEWLAEQQALLPRPVFERLWLNRWQHSDGEFVTLAEAEACRDNRLREQSHGRPHLHYVAAIDYAEKHDYTVGVIVHAETSSTPADPTPPRLVVDRMDVAVPTPNSPVRVDWVENWIRTIASQFHNITFIVDEYQLLGTIQRLESEYRIRRFEFRAGRGNHALALNLRRLIIHRQIAWYPHCGQLPAPHGRAQGEPIQSVPDDPGASSIPPEVPSIPPARDDLETELASLRLRQSPSGFCRFDHLPDNIHHDDRAFALGAACLHIVEHNLPHDWLQVTPPTSSGDFAW